MSHSRRGFLGLLAGIAAGAVLDPERLLWIPGAKTISIPAPIVESAGWRVVPVLSPSVQAWGAKFLSDYLASKSVEEQEAAIARGRISAWR